MEQVRLKRLVSRINVKSQTPNSESHIDLEDIQSWTGKQAPHVGDIETDQTTFQQGDVLFGKLRPYLAKVVRPLFDGTCSSELLVLRPGERVETNFLFYTAIDKKFIDLVDSSTYGAKMPRASWEFIGQIPVNTPSLEQQNAIGEFLDSKTTQIDNLISKKQRQIKLLKEKRSAIITEAVTKGVDPTVKMKDSGVKWLGEMPEHWELIRVKRAGTIRYGLGQPPNELDEGLPLIRATDLHAGFIDTQTMLYVDPDDIPWSKNPLLHVGEIIIVRSGAYTGDSAIIPETLGVGIPWLGKTPLSAGWVLSEHYLSKKGVVQLVYSRR